MGKSVCHNPAGLVSLSAAHSSFLSLTKPNFTSCPNPGLFSVQRMGIQHLWAICSLCHISLQKNEHCGCRKASPGRERERRRTQRRKMWSVCLKGMALDQRDILSQPINVVMGPLVLLLLQLSQSVEAPFCCRLPHSFMTFNHIPIR